MKQDEQEHRGEMNSDPAAGEFIAAAVQQYQQQLTLYALRVCGDADRARDVVQETFLKLCMQDRKLIEGHLTEWLYSVCRNHALDVKRKERRMTPLTECQDIASSEAISPDAQSERGEAAAGMMRMLSALPENQQEVLRLKFQHGLSYKEIATVTRLSASNVGFLIHTGLKSLRQRLAPAAERAPV